MEVNKSSPPKVADFLRKTGATLVVIFLLLSIFNYLNILPLSSVPLFSFLPHLPPNNSGTTTKSNDYSSYKEFAYDSNKAKDSLIKYTKSTVKEKLVPVSVEIKQGMTPLGTDGISKYQFGSFYSIENSTISLNLNLEENTNNASIYGIIIQLQKDNKATATASLANSILSSYYKEPYQVSVCDEERGISYCEKFQTTSEGKMGYGILTSPKGIDLFNCFIPKKSDRYKDAKSCVRL